MTGRMWEAVIKIDPADPRGKRAHEIAEGVRYACHLLRDEYGWEPDDIERLLESVLDEVSDR